MHIDLWHPTKNPDLDPREVGINSDFQVWWRGDCGHDFQQAVQRRAQSPFRSCQKCSHMGPTPRALLAQHPYADMWHPTKNDVDLASVGEHVPALLVARRLRPRLPAGRRYTDEVTPAHMPGVQPRAQVGVAGASRLPAGRLTRCRGSSSRQGASS